MTPEDRASAAVDLIVEDLRDRKMLKWLFCEDPDNAGDILPGLRPLDAEVQDEIYAEWERIIVKCFTRDEVA